MRQEPKRCTLPGGPEMVGRCPTCEAPFFSKYALKVHKQVANCSPPSAPAKGAGVVSQPGKAA